MQHRGLDAARCEQLGGLEHTLGHDPAGDQADIGAVAEHAGLSDLELVALGQDDGHDPAQSAHVGRAVVVGDGLDDLPHLAGVSRVDDDHVRQAPHQGYVLDGLVGRAAGRGDAGQKGEDLDVLPPERNRHRDLIERSPAGKDAVGGHERGVPDPRQPRRDAHHVRFGHADLGETLGKRLGERQDVRVFGQVSRESDDIRAGLPERQQRLPERRIDRLGLSSDRAHHRRVDHRHRAASCSSSSISPSSSRGSRGRT